LVGKSSVVGLSLDKGLSRWSVKLEAADGRPSGRGVAVGDRFFLPLDSGQLWTLDLQQGKVLQRSALVDGTPPLGNLSMYRGLLVSVGPRGVRTFEQRDAIRSEIERLTQKNADDPQALLLEASIARLELKHNTTRSLLDRIDPDTLDAVGRQKHQRMMVNTLSDVIRQNPGQHGAELKLLGRWVKTDAERLLLKRLLSENFVETKQYAAALKIYLDLIENGGTPLVQAVEGGQTRVRLDLWSAGKLQDLWEQLPGNQKLDVSQWIAQRATQALQGSVSDRQRFLRVFAFHPEAVRIRQQLADDRLEQGQVAESLAELDALSRSPDRAVQANALWKAGSILLQRELTFDAARRFDRLEREFADEVLSDGLSVRQKLAEQRARRDWPREPPAPIGWSTNGLRVRRAGTSYYSNHTGVLATRQMSEPSLQALKYELHQQLNRLSVVDAASDSMRWSLPLRVQSSGGAVGLAVNAVGHRLVMLHRGVIHCLSPVERRLLWTQPLESRGSGVRGVVRGNSSMQYRFVKGTAITQKSVISRARAGQRAGLAVVNDQYICVYDRRGFTVLDIRDGATLWKHRTGTVDGRVMGTPEYVYVVPPTGTPLALRALDGKKVKVKNLGALLAKTVRFVDNDCLVVESSRSFSLFGLGGNKTRLKLVDPIQGKARWTLDLPANTSMARLRDGGLLTLSSDGRLGSLDHRKGTIRKFAAADAEEVANINWKKMTNVVAVADANRLYLAVGGGTRFGGYYYNTPTIPVNGQLLAFDRQNGRFLWQQSVKNQNMVVSQMSYMPILLMMNFKYERKMNFGFSSMQLMAIDKRNGHILADEKLASSGLQAVTTNMAERYIEVRTYNMRIRLLASDTETAASK
ncbi:MAG: PQQ-binding-like beta-propeller repeat protein, partial [Planctomycetaceae bacterium]